MATTLAAVTPSVAQAAAQTLDLQVLLVGEGSTDPVTEAWESTLSSEGVPYTLVEAAGSLGSQTVTLPTLSSGSTGDFNGVVLAGSPADFAAGQLSALDTYESTFGVRQVDGYMFPSTALGLTETGGGALDGSTATLTSAGLSALPGLAGTIPFDTGTYGYTASAVVGAPVTPWLENSSGSGGILAAVYQHPSTDAQANVSELSLLFDYNSAQLQWLVLGPSVIDWLTQDAHLGLYRNYVEMDIDDTFTPDDAWDVTTHQNDYSDADALRMNPVDVDYAAQWEAANGFRMDQLFNGGGSVEYQADNGGPDPLLAEFQKKDPATGKPYADDFGWLSHTYDTPYLDVGCATQNYIEAELNENTNWAAAAPGATPGTGGLGLTESTSQSVILGAENPQVFVPGNHSGFADLDPGNPATVDPPDLDEAQADSGGGSLAAGTYDYAVTDQFTNSASAGQSQAYLTDPITVSAKGSATLQWQAICHASDYIVYREVAGSGDWFQIGTVSTPQSATLPDNSSGNPASTTDVTGGGELEQTFTDTGAAGTAEPAGWTPPSTENAVETPWEQNPYFTPALQAVGITVVGADASKPYPNPPDDQFGIGADYTGATYPAAATFVDGTAQVAPRHPINIYYNNSTEAQAVDEYNTLYLPPSLGGTCVASSTTTCLTAPATFADIVAQVDEGMFRTMLSNDPRPSYVHQTNLMGQPPAGPATSGTPPNTPDTVGDGLLYSVLNPLLAEYHSYFSSLTPFQQPALGQIGAILADQTAWTTAVASGKVTASETAGVVTVTNAGTSSVVAPITAPTGTTVNGAAFGSAYGAGLSAWDSIGAGASVTLSTPGVLGITSAATATSTVGTAFSDTITATGSPVPALTETGTLPGGVTFTDNGNGTATLAGTPAAGSGGSFPITITATNADGTVTQNFTLTNDQAPALTSPATAAFTVGAAGTYNITSTGYPNAKLTETGTLPAGLTFTDGGNGTGTIAGTAAAGTAGTYPVTLTADNGVGTAATLNLTVTVSTAPAPTVTATASGALSVSALGAAPAGAPAVTQYSVTFGDGGAAVTGTSATATHTYAKPGTYTITETVTYTGGATASATASFTTAGTDFTAYGPARLLDTRNGTGAAKAQIAAGGKVTLKIAGVGSIPSGVSAVVLNLTATNTSGTGYVTAYADGSAVPTATNLNYTPGSTIANEAVVPVGADGSVDLANGGTSAGKIDLIADVSGYFTHASAGGFTSLTPARLLDTRNGTGAAKAKVAAGKSVVLTVAGADGGKLPASGITAVSLHVTTTDTTGSGNITVYPDGTTLPTASNLNYTAGATVGNTVIVPVGADGKVDLNNGGASAGPVDLIADVTGYYSTSGTGAYVALAPTRLLDTRQSTALKAGGTDTVTPDKTVTSIPAAAAGFVFDITLTGTSGTGQVTAYPSGVTEPNVSSVNYVPNQTVANLAQVAAGTGGAVAFNNNGTSAGTIQLIVDLYGYYSAS